MMCCCDAWGYWQCHKHGLFQCVKNVRKRRRRRIEVNPIPIPVRLFPCRLCPPLRRIHLEGPNRLKIYPKLPRKVICVVLCASLAIHVIGALCTTKIHLGIVDYAHIFMTVLPRQMRLWGDLWRFSTRSVEGRGGQLKRIGRCTTPITPRASNAVPTNIDAGLRVWGFSADGRRCPSPHLT